MGDTTYNHIYHDSTTGSVTQRMQRAKPGADDDSPGLQAQHLLDQSRTPEQTLSSQGPQEPHQAVPAAAVSQGMDALHNAIVGNLQFPSPANGGVTPQGEPGQPTSAIHDQSHTSMSRPIHDALLRMPICQAYSEVLGHLVCLFGGISASNLTLPTAK